MIRRRGQSLVEFALIAPVVILLAMAVWDGGSALREQIVLQQAARDGARAGATAYGGAQQSIIQNAVVVSAADLPTLSSTSGFLTVTSNTQSLTVQLQYPHVLITPILRQLWSGGRGTLTLSASATFYVPQLTPTPGTIVPSTPIPSATPTPTVTPTPTPSRTPTPNLTRTSTPAPPTATPTLTPSPTATATATPGVANACSAIPNSQLLPFMSSNTGYWCNVRLTTPSFIVAYWFDDFDSNNQLQIYFDNPGPSFGGDPSSLSPPNGIGVMSRAGNGALWNSTYGCVQTGTYSIYFFNRGTPFPASYANVSVYPCF